MCLFQIKDHEEQNQSKVNDLWPTQDNIASGDMSYSYDTFSERFSGENQLKPQDNMMQETCKEYKCKYCIKSFSQGGSLNRHIHTIHDGHKDHKCKICGKSFSDRGNLHTHIQFMKAAKIKNVNIVLNHLLEHNL